MAAQQSESLSDRSGPYPAAFETEREMTHYTCHSFPASSPALALNTSENSSDGSIFYLTHADLFCIKT